MYKTCPKCHYQRQPGDVAPEGICPQCGLVFAKWLQQRLRSEVGTAEHRPVGRIGRLLDMLLVAEERPNPVVVWGRAALFLLLFIWGWYFILLEMESNAIGNSFMHAVNLVFHEAGHVIFRLLGNFMMVLGGSLFQILVPLIVMGAFIRQQNNFAASVGLWWAGQSMMDIAPYINDARARQLPLLGGGDGRDRPWMHDWYNILGDLGMLNRDHAIAAFVDTLGELTVILALAWGGFLLYQQFSVTGRAR